MNRLQQLLGSHSLLPGRGIGKLVLGMTEEEVIHIMGIPDSIEEEDDAEDEAFSDLKDRYYNYDEMGISLSFDALEQYRLTDITIENPDFTLHNAIHPGISKKQCENIIASLNWEETEYNDLTSEELGSYEMIYYEKENIHLWFDSGVLESIDMGILWKNENEISWPENLSND